MAWLPLPPSERIGWNDASFSALVAAFPNTGFMGVPLLVALTGAQAAGPAIVTILISLVITTSLCIALSRLDGADGMAPANPPKMRSRGVAATHALGHFLGGLALSLQFELPKPVMQTLGLLADAASPVALFTIGAVLARSRIVAARRISMLCRRASYVPVVLAELLLHPVLVWRCVARHFGLPLDRFTLTGDGAAGGTGAGTSNVAAGQSVSGPTRAALPASSCSPRLRPS